MIELLRGRGSQKAGTYFFPIYKILLILTNYLKQIHKSTFWIDSSIPLLQATVLKSFKHIVNFKHMSNPTNLSGTSHEFKVK